MTKAKIERKVAVIFAADVVDYRKHMEADENSTVQRLRECEKILTDLFTQFTVVYSIQVAILFLLSFGAQSPQLNVRWPFNRKSAN